MDNLQLLANLGTTCNNGTVKIALSKWVKISV